MIVVVLGRRNGTLWTRLKLPSFSLLCLGKFWMLFSMFMQTKPWFHIISTCTWDLCTFTYVSYTLHTVKECMFLFSGNKARRLGKKNNILGNSNGPKLNLKPNTMKQSTLRFKPKSRLRRSILFPMLKLFGLLKRGQIAMREINTSIQTPQELYKIMFKEINNYIGESRPRKVSFEVGRNNFLKNLFGRRNLLSINSE